jgi:hypothetical protein
MSDTVSLTKAVLSKATSAVATHSMAFDIVHAFHERLGENGTLHVTAGNLTIHTEVLVMKTLIGLIAFASLLSLGVVRVTSAADEMAAPGSKTIEGDVLKIEGEFYTVHDTAGHEVRVHVDKTTKLDGCFKTGDKVKVEVTEKGHALSMTRVAAAGGGWLRSAPRLSKEMC